MRARIRALIPSLLSSFLVLLLAGALIHDNASGAPASPLSRVQILGLLAGGVSNERITILVKKRGIDFRPDPIYLRKLRQAGADRMLLATVRSVARGSAARSTVAIKTPRTGVSDHNEIAASCLTIGARLMRRRLYREAEGKYRAGLRVEPNDPSLKFALAHALEEEGKWSESAAEYRAVLKADPDDPFATNNLAVALDTTGSVDAAIDQYHRALSVEPTSATLHNNLGLALQKKGDIRGATDEFQKAIRAEPSDSHAHNNLGSALEHQGDLDGALREYRMALKLDKGCCQAQYNMARVLEIKGDLNGAVVRPPGRLRHFYMVNA